MADPDDPPRLADGPQFIRLTDAPARIRLEAPDDDEGGPLVFSIEDYDVPDEGGNVLPFRSRKPTQ